MNDEKRIRSQRPIYPSDIERYRESIRLGQQIRINVQAMEMDFQKRMVSRWCIVTEKYKWLFIAEDERGKKHAVTYIEQMKKEGWGN